MSQLVLVIVEYSKSERKEEEHEEVELLLEGYRSDLEEIIIELRSFHSQIDDTKEFINSHQVFCFSNESIILFTLHVYASLFKYVLRKKSIRFFSFLFI